MIQKFGKGQDTAQPESKGNTADCSEGLRLVWMGWMMDLSSPMFLKHAETAGVAYWIPKLEKVPELFDIERLAPSLPLVWLTGCVT